MRLLWEDFVVFIGPVVGIVSVVTRHRHNDICLENLVKDMEAKYTT